MKTCPYCAEEIKDAAIICRYCGKDQPPLEIRSKTNIHEEPTRKYLIILISVLWDFTQAYEEVEIRFHKRPLFLSVRKWGEDVLKSARDFQLIVAGSGKVKKGHIELLQKGLTQENLPALFSEKYQEMFMYFNYITYQGDHIVKNLEEFLRKGDRSSMLLVERNLTNTLAYLYAIYKDLNELKGEIKEEFNVTWEGSGVIEPSGIDS